MNRTLIRIARKLHMSPREAIVRLKMMGINVMIMPLPLDNKVFEDFIFTLLSLED